MTQGFKGQKSPLLKRRWIAFFWILGLSLAHPLSASAESMEVAVVYSSSLEAYGKAWGGFKAFFEEKGVTLISSEYNLEKHNVPATWDQINSKKPRIVLTLGTKAFSLTRENVKDVPIVYCMIMKPVPNATGVTMDIHPELKLAMVKRAFPNVKRIGLIYSQDTLSEYETIQRVCKTLGLELIARQSNSEKDLPEALKDIFWRIDYFLMLPDTRIYSTHSVEYLLLESLRNKFAVIGLSSFYTKAGALVSFDCDYPDLGKQAGEIAQKVINGENPASVQPRKTRYSLNSLAAERLGIAIPNDVKRDASEIFGK